MADNLLSSAFVRQVEVAASESEAEAGSELSMIVGSMELESVILKTVLKVQCNGKEQ
jgi:hypothetical protein